MRAKVFKAFLTVISALLISEAFFVVIHFIIADRYQRVTDNLVAEYQLTKKTSDLVNSFYDLIQYSNDPQRTQIFNDNLSALHALLAKLDRNLAYGDSWTVYVGVRNTINVVISEVNKGLEDISAENFSEVTADYLRAANDNNFVRENAGDLILRELDNVEKTERQMAETKFWSELAGLILFFVVMAGSVLYAVSFSKKCDGYPNPTELKPKDRDKKNKAQNAPPPDGQ